MDHEDLDKLQTEQRESAEKFRAIEVEDFKWLMADKRGRRYVWRLLSLTRVFQSSFTGNSHTFFNEGTRNVGLKILEDINSLCPERYLQMLQENKANESRSRTRDH